MPKALKNWGLQTRRRPTKRERHEWEAFLGLIPALAVAQAPVGLADQCRRVVGAGTSILSAGKTSERQECQPRKEISILP